MNERLIWCSGLSKSFGKERALNDVNLDVGRGRIIALLGPNGSGKTTFMKILCGLMQPTSGWVTINGRAIGADTKAIVSYLPDRMYYANWMRVQDMVELFATFYADFDSQKAAGMFKSLDIDPKRKLKSLSRGTREQVQIVLVMSRKAQLYLLDEPIAGVDPAARELILNTILTNYNQDGTVLISTQLIADIEPILDDTIMLDRGSIVKNQTVDDIRMDENKSVDAFFRDKFRAKPMQGGEG